MGIIFGIDVGIASVGAAVVNNNYEVLESVSNLFESADASGNAERRTFRQGKRLIRRRNTRISDFNKLLSKYNCEISNNNVNNQLELRVKGLNEMLTRNELLTVLKYMLKHRGISYLDDIDENSSNSSEYLNSLKYNAELLEKKYPCEIQLNRMNKYNQFRGENTVTNEEGELVHISNVFTTSSYKKEIECILEKQKTICSDIGANFATEYMDIWNRKREYYIGPGNEKSRTDYGVYSTKINEDTGKYITEENIFEKLIGKCSVYSSERRAAGASYTAQEFNALNDLNNIFVNGIKLEKEQKIKIIEKYKNSNSVNVQKIIMEVLSNKDIIITGARVDKDGKDIFHKFETYNKMRKMFEKNGLNLLRFSREELDLVAEILTLNTEREAILKSIELRELKLSKEEIDVLINFRRNNSSLFSKWQSLSCKLMIELIPDLYERSVNQQVLLTEMGVFKNKVEIYKERESIPVNELINELYNPVVRRSIRVTIKVINALLKKYGDPEEIIIEMPRDKNSDEEKKRLMDIQKNNEKELKAIIKRVKEEYGIEIVDDNFRNHKKLALKLKLWNEQDGICPYSGKIIMINDILENPNLFEIDHIIPKSISYDDSRNNKVLVYRSENQHKGNMTPYMYLHTIKREWDYSEYMNYVLSQKNKKKINKTKVNNMLYDGDITKIDVIKGFISRNLNDTRYASREILNIIQGYFKAKGSTTKVKVIRGSVTHELRNALRLEKDRDKSFSHHAVDAMIMCYSQMGIKAYHTLLEEVVDFEKEEVINKDKFEELFSDKAYEELVYQNKLYTIRKNILNAEKLVKFNHRVDHKCNRALSNATIYGTREYDDKIRKVCKLNIRTDAGVKKFVSLVEDDKKGNNKREDILMFRNDPKTFGELMSIYKSYRDSKNPFVEYEKETGDKIRKYSKNNKGPIIQYIKYLDSEVNSCIDISHNYGLKKGEKSVVLDVLNPYRADVYYNNIEKKYYIVGVKYAHFKYSKGNYTIDEKAYDEILRMEKVLKSGENRDDLKKLEIEYMFSLYKNDIIYYEKDGEYYTERFLSRTMPKVMNYIETKPVYAKGFGDKRKTVGLNKTKCIRKINTDILGNRYWCDREKFNLVIEI